VVLLVVRYAVFATAALVSLGALAAMAVQRRSLNPFGHPARQIRRLTDPMLKPIERRLLKRGGNPQSAPWWLLGIAILGGILVISAAEWIIREAAMARMAAQGGGIVRLVVGWVFRLLQLALLVRVIGSWIGATRWTPWMKPFYLATEWMLAPLRRVIPAFGPLDLTPLVAWFLLGILGQWLIPRL
jgi:YggT family protein